MGALRYPIGLSDFRRVREAGAQYVDKTAFIDEVLSISPDVILLPRPRRFGKTLNLSMLRCFLERGGDNKRPLFAGLEIERRPAAWPHFQRYPVIFLSFKDVRGRSWPHCFASMRSVLSALYTEHEYLLQSGTLRPHEATQFTAILEGRADEPECTMALAQLSRHLAAHHNEKVVILIDEYDTPIHAGYSGGYYDDAVAFFRSFLSAGLKDNPELRKGVLSGVLRIAKESIFSGLNNMAVYSLLRSEFSAHFGFTEDEVAKLTAEAGEPSLLDGIRAWYDGYSFAGRVIYNPWSVLNFLDSADKQFRAYWISTSSNEIVRDLLSEGPLGLRPELEALLRGESIEKPIDEDIALRDVARHPDALWSLLLFSGYLRTLELQESSRGLRAKLAIPNQDVFRAFSAMVDEWLSARAGGSDQVAALLEALLRGDTAELEQHLSRMMQVSLSYHDTAGDASERLFHGFIVGLLVNLGARYEVRSNRESGFGRYDVMVLPKRPGDPGVVLELKAIDRNRGDDEQIALDEALPQIRTRDYQTELRERGANPIHELAAAFDGNRAWVKAVEQAR